MDNMYRERARERDRGILFSIATAKLNPKPLTSKCVCVFVCVCVCVCVCAWSICFSIGSPVLYAPGGGSCGVTNRVTNTQSRCRDLYIHTYLHTHTHIQPSKGIIVALAAVQGAAAVANPVLDALIKSQGRNPHHTQRIVADARL